MKKAGKILLLILCIALAVGMTAAAALTTSAQVCVWTLYVDGEAYTTGIPGVSFSGNTVTLNGFSGKSIAAIPGGFIGDDDAPVLNIVLIGDNTLSGSYFTNTGVSAQYSADAWYGGIYAYTREGGSGKDSIVNISGSGSLSVNYAPFSRSVSKACNYKAICCGDLNINGGAKVKINYMPRGIGKKTDDTYYSVKGVDAYNVSLKSGILDINVGSLSSINNITKVITRSYADVYGIDAYNIYVDNDYGYMSLDLSSNGGSSNKSLCTSACIRYSAKAPMYLINKNGELRSESKEIIFGSGVWQAGVDYKIFAASRNTNINYEAYGPVSYNDITNNSALTEVYLSDVIAAMTFPKIGDKQLNQTSYTKKDSFYFRETSYLCDVETGQSYLSNTWSEYEEKPDEYMYEFDIHALPAPGFWYVPWQSYFIDAYIDQCLDYEPEYSWIQSSGVAVCYRYGEAIFTVQPKPVCCYFTEISAVAEIKYCPDIKYEWFVDIYDSTGKKAKTMSMEYFDEMNYGFTGQNERTMFLGSFEKDETVPECDFTFAEASKFELYCVAGSVSSEAVSEKAEYYPFGHNIVKTAAKAATCTQAGNSEYYKCTACGELFSDPKGENKITLAQTVVSAKGHAPVKVEAKAATCTAAGNEAYYTCKNCKKVFSDSACTKATTAKAVTVAAKGHTPVKTAAKAATCTASGNKAYYTCKVCKKVFSDSACTKATTVKAMTVAAKGHTKVTDAAIKATFTKSGKTAGSHCSVCGKVITAQKTVYMVKTPKLSATKYTYNGKVKTPTVTVTDSKGKALVKNTDYTVTYASGRKAPGKYSVKITLKGKYSGSKTLYFTIAPKQVTGVKAASSAKKTAKVTFTKATGATGYQIYYSTKKTSDFKKLGTATTNSFTYKKLTSGKTYYFKVRAYKKSADGTYIYGAFSAAVAKKIK